MPTARKQIIADAYRRVVEVRGKVVSQALFQRLSGISAYYWRGGYWPSWSAFQRDLGFEPNRRTEKIPDEYLLRRYAELAMERDKLPTNAEMKLRRNQDRTFPDPDVFGRLGRRAQRMLKLAVFCESRPEFARVVELVREERTRLMARQRSPEEYRGIVYLVRAGDEKRIGRECATGARLSHIAARTSVMPDTVHVIETDDPVGIERYWLRRFRAKRTGRKTFRLAFEDVWAFRRRKYQ